VSTPDGSRRDADGLLELLPAAGRLVASTWWHTAEWTVGAGLRAGSRIARATLGHERAPLPISDLVGRQRPSRERGDATPSGLRERGAELLRRSADVEQTEDLHPAYARILEDLAPDEARILRLLATEGDQAAIDVKTWRPFGVGSETVQPGVTMVAARAGTRHRDRIAAYLNNLFRLGLIWFSHEPIDNLSAYQVLEAQPETAEAWERAGRARIVRRSIRLTAFGRDFCDRCLPCEGSGRGPGGGGPGQV
jgi:hypothetical protein